jgi:uncharacterized protein YifN (PemK superfamily)
MPLKFLPYPGSILRCDFQGFKEPEMVKPRPVVVISARPERVSRRTCIIVPLSTSAPDPIQQYHLEVSLPGALLPKDIQKQCWVKGDMIYAVSLDRLDLYRVGRDTEGKRAYYYNRFDNKSLFEIRKAVAHAIGLHL